MSHRQRREDSRLRAFVVSELVAREQSLEPWTPASDEPCPCDACNSPPWDETRAVENTDDSERSAWMGLGQRTVAKVLNW